MRHRATSLDFKIQVFSSIFSSIDINSTRDRDSLFCCLTQYLNCVDKLTTINFNELIKERYDEMINCLVEGDPFIDQFSGAESRLVALSFQFVCKVLRSTIDLASQRAMNSRNNNSSSDPVEISKDGEHSSYSMSPRGVNRVKCLLTNSINRRLNVYAFQLIYRSNNKL